MHEGFETTAFHDGLIGFTDIVDTVQQVVAAADRTGSQDVLSEETLTVDDVLAADAWARATAASLIGRQ